MREQRCAICGMLDFFGEPVDWSKVKEKDLGGFPSEEKGLILENVAMRCKKCGYTSFDITKNLLKDTEILKDEEYLKILSDDTLGKGKNLFMLGYLLEKQESFLSSAMAYSYLAFLFEKEGNFLGMREGRKRSIFSFLKHIGTDSFKKNPSMEVYQHFVDALRRQKMFDKAIIFCDIALNLAQSQKMRKIFLLEKSLCLNYIDSSHSYDFEEDDSILSIINNLTDCTKQSNEKDLKSLRAYMDEAILYPLTRGADIILKVGKDIKYSDFAEKVKELYLFELSKTTKKQSPTEKVTQENLKPDTSKEDLQAELSKLKKEKEWLREEISQLEQDKSDFDVEMTFFESEKEALRVKKDNLKLKEELLQKKENRLTDMETGLNKLQENLTKERILLEKAQKELELELKNVTSKKEEEPIPFEPLNLDSFGIYDQLKQGLTFSNDQKTKTETQGADAENRQTKTFSQNVSDDQGIKDNLNLSREITQRFDTIEKNLSDHEMNENPFISGYTFTSHQETQAFKEKQGSDKQTFIKSSFEEEKFEEEISLEEGMSFDKGMTFKELDNPEKQDSFSENLSTNENHGEEFSTDKQIITESPLENENNLQNQQSIEEIQSDDFSTAQESDMENMSQEEKDLAFLHKSAAGFSDSSDLEELFDQDIISLFRQKVKENEEYYKTNETRDEDETSDDDENYNEEIEKIAEPHYSYEILKENEPINEDEFDDFELLDNDENSENEGSGSDDSFEEKEESPNLQGDPIEENTQMSEDLEENETIDPPNLSFFDNENLLINNDSEDKTNNLQPEESHDKVKDKSYEESSDVFNELSNEEIEGSENEELEGSENEELAGVENEELGVENEELAGVENEETFKAPNPFQNVMEDFYREKGETLEKPTLSPDISFEEDLNWKEEVLEIIKKEKKITIGEVQMLFGLGYKEAKDILEELLSEGYLKSDGDSYNYKEED